VVVGVKEPVAVRNAMLKAKRIPKLVYLSKEVHDESRAASRRGQSRILSSADCAVEFRKGILNRFCTEPCEDISSSGLGFETRERFRPGQILHLTLVFSTGFPGLARLDVTAAVTRVDWFVDRKKFFVGCKFESLPPQKAEILWQFIWWCHLRGISETEKALLDSHRYSLI